MITNQKKKIIKLVEVLNINQQAKQLLIDEIKLMQKNLIYSNLKIKRTLKDKEIISDSLNETIKRLEIKIEALTIQEKELEEQSKFKEQLRANFNHEIKTLLFGFLSACYLLEQSSLNGIQNDYSDLIKGGADNFVVIIDDTLGLSVINAGKVKITNNLFSIRNLLSDLETMMKLKTKKKGIQLLFNLSADFPEYICGDQTRIYQIIVLLFIYSIRFTGQGFIRLRGEVVFVAGETRLQFELDDSGIGIKKEKLESIFEIFKREEEKRSTDYEGVGLKIIKKLLYLLSGSIAVENIKNMGSVFRVQIPFQLPNDQVDENLIHDQRNTVIPEMWTKLNFLMIENNVDNILIAKDLFKSWNLKLDIFDTLRNAEKALDNKYDCILFDTFLPDGNGLDFIIELRKNPVSKNYKTPVVLMTVGLNEVEVSQAKDANIESYLSKPFPPYFLIKEFHKILGIHTIPNKLENKLHSKKTNLSKKVSSEGLGNSFLETLSKRLKGRTTLMAEMAKIFLDQATVMRSILENAHEKGDYESIRFEAHKFKSTVNIIGLDALKVLASKTEEIYYDGKPEECTASLLNNFVKQIDKDTLKVKMSMKEIFQENADKLKVNSN